MLWHKLLRLPVQIEKGSFKCTLTNHQLEGTDTSSTVLTTNMQSLFTMRAHAHVFELQAEIRLVFAMYVVLVEVDGWFGFSYFYLFVILLLLSLEVPHVYSYRFFSVTRLQTCVQHTCAA